MSARLVTILVAAVCGTVVCGCVGEHDKEPPAGDELAVKTAGQLSITVDAQARIGLKTAPVTSESIRARQQLTGWLRRVPATEVTAKSPATGFVDFVDKSRLEMGDRVTRDQPLGAVHVLLSPQDQERLVAAKEEVDTIVRQARATRELAQQHLQQIRAKASTAVAGIRLLELKEQIARAEAAEQEALERLPFLPTEPYRDGLQLKPIPITAPVSGRITDLGIAPGQFVVQGDVLWTISNWSRLWLRVPVYRGDLTRIARNAPAVVEVPGTTRRVTARPLAIPQATEMSDQTVDLLFELDNDDGALRPGDSVSVWLPINAAAPALVVARSAVLWDGNGNSWVYVRTSATTFRRQRVELGAPDGDRVVVRRGLQADQQVVVMGAELLYGSEFQWQIPAEDDD